MNQYWTRFSPLNSHGEICGFLWISPWEDHGEMVIYHFHHWTVMVKSLKIFGFHHGSLMVKWSYTIYLPNIESLLKTYFEHLWKDHWWNCPRGYHSFRQNSWRCWKAHWDLDKFAQRNLSWTITNFIHKKWFLFRRQFYLQIWMVYWCISKRP